MAEDSMAKLVQDYDAYTKQRLDEYWAKLRA